MAVSYLITLDIIIRVQQVLGLQSTYFVFFGSPDSEFGHLDTVGFRWEQGVIGYFAGVFDLLADCLDILFVRSLLLLAPFLSMDL